MYSKFFIRYFLQSCFIKNPSNRIDLSGPFAKPIYFSPFKLTYWCNESLVSGHKTLIRRSASFCATSNRCNFSVWFVNKRINLYHKCHEWQTLQPIFAYSLIYLFCKQVKNKNSNINCSVHCVVLFDFRATITLKLDFFCTLIRLSKRFLKMFCMAFLTVTLL